MIDLSTMAKAEYLISLIKSHYGDKPERFSTIALQIAAYEAKLGHNEVASEIKSIVDKAKSDRSQEKGFDKDLHGLIYEAVTRYKIADLIVSDGIRAKINRILREFVQRDKLRRHGLENRRKLLLSGPPGTGKTMTASIIANEVDLPLYTILLHKMVTKFMGETSAKLRLVFDLINDKRGVYLFDEFDAIGGERSRENDVGEMRRVLNSFLQFIERDESDSLIIAITNNKGLLDTALFRRFDDVVVFTLPSDEEKLELLRGQLSPYSDLVDFSALLPHINGLSHAEISLACQDALKETILDDVRMSSELILRSIEDRNTAYHP